MSKRTTRDDLKPHTLTPNLLSSASDVKVTAESWLYRDRAECGGLGGLEA